MPYFQLTVPLNTSQVHPSFSSILFILKNIFFLLMYNKSGRRTKKRPTFVYLIFSWPGLSPIIALIDLIAESLFLCCLRQKCAKFLHNNKSQMIYNVMIIRTNDIL